MIYGEEKNPAYDHLNAEKTMKERNGTQAGDPIKGAQAFYELGVMDDPPLRVVIGTDACACTLLHSFRIAAPCSCRSVTVDRQAHQPEGRDLLQEYPQVREAQQLD